MKYSNEHSVLSLLNYGTFTEMEWFLPWNLRHGYKLVKHVHITLSVNFGPN